MAMWPSCTRGVESLGVTSATSHRAAKSRPLSPVIPMTVRPCWWATSIAATTFGDPPLVLMATSTSPATPRPSSWRANTRSKPKSLPMAVSAELFVVSDTAASAGRSTR